MLFEDGSGLAPGPFQEVDNPMGSVTCDCNGRGVRYDS